MKTQSASFILIPRVWTSQSQPAELHLIVIDDNGVKLGVLATVHDNAMNPAERCLSCEALSELREFEKVAVMERIKKEIADGNIDKAFAFDMPNAVKGHPTVTKNADLFQFNPSDKGELVCIERDRIQKFLDVVQDEYCTI